ncbi:hypothetical protein BC828DRAFT_130303 [Blastocladiella britannica]|nr:hypothetical protein BC828DRAFT_130303 [Blastocladiella britannica]
MTLLQYYNWTTVNVVASRDTYATGLSTSLHNDAPAQGINIATSWDCAYHSKPSEMAGIIQGLLNSPSRVVVVMGDVNIVYALFMAGAAAGLVPSEWVWICTEGAAGFPLFLSGLPPGNFSQAAAKLVDGIMFMNPVEGIPSAPRYQQAVAQWQGVYGNTDIFQCPYCFFFHSCLEAHVRGVLALAQKYGPAAVVARSHSATLVDYLVPFDSSTGPVAYVGANRKGVYQVLNYLDGAMVTALTIHPNGVVEPTGSTIRFPGNRTEVPDWATVYPLGFISWREPMIAVTVALAASTGLVIFATAWVLVYYRKTRRVRHLGLQLLLPLVIGLSVVGMMPMMQIGKFTPLMCALQNWLLLIGQTLYLSAILVKTYRVYRVHDNRILATSKSLRTRNIIARVLTLPFLLTVMMVFENISSSTSTALELVDGQSHVICVFSQPLAHTVLVSTGGTVPILQ